MVVSSAYVASVVNFDSGRSAVYKEYRTGPRMLPSRLFNGQSTICRIRAEIAQSV
jgi:hypothetical protein